MMIDAKCKQCRREKEKLFLKGDRCFTPKCAMIKKPYAPGMHGKKFKRAGSEYGVQLREKQKVKRTYGIAERQFRKYYETASRRKGVIGEAILFAIEKRLDNVIYRMGLAKSRGLARQIVSHGHVLVERNGKKRKVDIPSFVVKVGDKIYLKESSLPKGIFKDLATTIKNYEFPSWLKFDGETFVGEVLNEPTMNDVNINANMQLIVELYAR
ncbi:30S ribosomal protein S4 [bacterium]|nr:MAG: 30S ribosomal protein S4 [bacterium]